MSRTCGPIANKTRAAERHAKVESGASLTAKKVCAHPDLLRPDAQVEVEAGLQQQVLHIVGVDGEVEVQGVSQQLVGLLIALPDRKHTVNLNIECSPARPLLSRRRLRALQICKRQSQWDSAHFL